MPDEFRDLWKYAPVVAILLLAFWAGHKGLWYWGPGMRMVIEKLEKERDDWKRLALALMERQGIQLPDEKEDESKK